MSQLSEVGAASLAVMTAGPVSHPRFKGQPLDVEALTPHDLGQLLPTALQISHDLAAERQDLSADTPPQVPSPAQLAAQDVVLRCFPFQPRHGDEEPIFRPEDATAVLRLMAAAMRTRKTSHSPDDILAVLAGCEKPIPELPSLLAPLLPSVEAASDSDKRTTSVDQRPHGWIYLAQLTGTPEADQLVNRLRTDLAHAPLLLAELDLMKELPSAGAQVLARQASVWASPRSDAELEPPGTYALGHFEGYLAFSQRALASALDRVERIHDGRELYAADKAFVPQEGQVLGRCARTALDQDAPWLDQLLDPLWVTVSVAPGTAKTMPSQSVAIALGRAVEEMPNSAALTTMRRVIGATRHAGIKKKLSQMLKTAERRIAERPDLLLQLKADAAIPKSMVAAVRRSYENLYRSRVSFDLEAWTARFVGHKDVCRLTEKLIWRVAGNAGAPFSAIPVVDKKSLIWLKADGTTVASDASQVVALWHPLEANSDDRDAWRDRVIADRIEQPFLQAFRQFYVPPEEELPRAETTMLAGHNVSIKPVSGVARSQGWSLERGVGFALTIADLVFHADFGGSVTPGLDGARVSGPLRAYRRVRNRSRAEPAALTSIDPVLLSEVIRAVDLLISVGAIAHDPQALTDLENSRRRTEGSVGYAGIYFPPDPIAVVVGHSAAIRREILKRLYSTNTTVHVTARYVEIGDHAIHLATGRVTRHGEHVEVPVSDGSDPSIVWLPHQDAVLERVVRCVRFLNKGGG